MPDLPSLTNVRYKKHFSLKRVTLVIKKNTIITAIPIIFLLLATFHTHALRLPYVFFQLLRFVVCGTAVYLGWITLVNDKSSVWTWCFGFIAILFNPFIPFYFKRDLWQIMDIVTAVVLTIFLFTFKLPKELK